jgi:hypothetical protein
MGGNPVETKVEAAKAADVLAAVAGVPTPAQAVGLGNRLWNRRKSALLLAGSALALGGATYGYKYFTPNPGKANAQPDAPTVAAAKSDEAPRVIAPAVDMETSSKPAKTELPDVPSVESFTIQPPPEGDKPAKRTTFGSDKTDTEPPAIAPILPPTPGDKSDDGKKPAKSSKGEASDPPIDFKIPAPPGEDTKKPAKVEEPSLSGIKFPGDKAKPAAGGPDQFQAPAPVPGETDKPAVKMGPSPRPTDGAGKETPILRTGGMDPMPPAPPGGKDDSPIIPPAPAPGKKDDIPAPPVPGIDPIIPPTPMPMKSGDPIVSPPAGGKDDSPIILPGTGAPKEKPEAKTPELPTIKIDAKLPDAPSLPGDPPATRTPTPPVGLDPLPSIGPAPVSPATGKKTDYEEDWHTRRSGDTMAVISQEFYHDGRYAAALEAYNTAHRPPGDRMIRVPPPWVLEDQYPQLIKAEKDKADKSDRPAGPESRSDQSEARPAGSIQFEPAPAITPGRRPPPPPASPVSRSNDEYRVTNEAGEMVRQVAEKALGDQAAWKKLYELNPTIDPTLPIPAGTVLKLPK